MTTAAHRNEKEAVKKWSLRLRSSQPPFSFLFRREENISNKNLYTVLSGRCSPFPYVVTLLYHTNIDNCVTKTRSFSEFSIFITCSKKQCIWEFIKFVFKCNFCRYSRKNEVFPYKIVQMVAILRSGINVFHLSNCLHKRKKSTSAHCCARAI